MVYRARDERLGREVALKVLPTSQTADPVAKARMLREAQTASSLNHPHICHIYEIGEAGGHSFIAMELVEGRPLSGAIPQGGLPMDAVLRYGEQMADALEHAHTRNVLHRDIKSSNVVVTPEGRVKILDFGLAKRVSEDIANEATLSQVSPLTQAGAIAGTLSYLAPEVLSGHPADARSDLWALGVVLYEMASGTLPFQGRTSFEATSAILRESPKPLPPRVPPGLRSVIQRCLAKEPAQRYQRASEVRAALEALGSGVTPVAAAAAAPTFGQAAETERGQPTWTWVLGGIVLLAAAFLIWDNFFSAHSRSPKPPEPPRTTEVPKAASTASAPATNAIGTLSGEMRPSPNPEANEYVARALLFLHGRFDPARARPLIDRALELDPKFADARTLSALLMVLAVESGSSNESAWIYKAEQEVRKSLVDCPECANAHGVLAAVYYFQGKPAEGLGTVEAASRLGYSTSLQLWKARLLALRGDSAAALEAVRTQTAAEPTFFPARGLLAALLLESGDRAGAIREIGKVLEQHPENLFALCLLANAHVASGDLKAAREFLNRLPQSDANNYRARLGRAQLLAAEGKRRDALRELDAQALKYAELNPSVTLQVAEIYTSLGDTAQALSWIERAVRVGDERIEWFKGNPLLAKLRENARFQQIVDSVAFRRGQK